MATKINLSSGFDKIFWLSSTVILGIRYITYGDNPGDGNGWRDYIIIEYQVSTNGGSTWGSPVTAASTTSFGSGTPMFADAVMDNSQNVYILLPFDGQLGSIRAMQVKLTKGLGNTWTGTMNWPTAGSTVFVGAYTKSHRPRLLIFGTRIFAVAASNPNYSGGTPTARTGYTDISNWTNSTVSWTTDTPGFGPGHTLAVRGSTLTHIAFSAASGNRRINWRTWTGSGWSSWDSTTDNFVTENQADFIKALRAAPLPGNRLIVVYTVGRILGPYDSGTSSSTQGVYYTIYDGTTWSSPTTIEEQTGLSTSDVFYTQPSLHYDGTSVTIAFGRNVSGTGSHRAYRYYNNALETGVTLTGFDPITDSFLKQYHAPTILHSNAPEPITYLPTISAGNFDGSNYTWFLHTIDNNYPPLQPTGLNPSGGVAVSSLTPTLTWTHNPGSPGDTQSAYRIEVIRQSDSNVMWDSGKITSTASTAVVPGGASLAFGVNYQWRVKTWSAADLEGPYSSLAVFKTSQKPVVSITSPTDSGSVSSNTPVISWNYSDSESTPQLSYRVFILNDVGDTTLYDSNWQMGTATTFQIPLGILFNETDYKVRVRVRDSDSITSDDDEHLFTVNFVAPPTPSVIASVIANYNVQLAITVNPPADDAWWIDSLKIYRKKPADSDYQLIAENVNLPSQIVTDLETTDGWSESGTATSPVQEDGKSGEYSLGLGASGSGLAIYESTINVPNISSFDQIQAWFQTLDVSEFDTIELRFGQDDSNYYFYTVNASDMANGVWKMAFKNISDLDTEGSPTQSGITYLAIVVDANGAISAGDIKVDQIRFTKTAVTYIDYTPENSTNYIYAVTGYNEQEFIESGFGVSNPVEIKFAEDKINMYFIPIGNEELTVKSFMDGTKVPNWVDRTETKYYQTRGSQKPSVIINGMQSYKEGSIELRFFDAKFGGAGLSGVEAFTFIKNFKPILLKAWWGRNYYISIDGDLNVVRRPGIGWYVTFNFTEINQ